MNTLTLGNQNQLKSDCSLAMEKCAIAEATVKTLQKNEIPLRNEVRRLESKISEIVVKLSEVNNENTRMHCDQERLLNENEE